MRHIVLTSAAPVPNLAIGETLFRALAPNQSWHPVLQNAPCIVIGRHHNAAEVDASALAVAGVQLLGRITGGGIAKSRTMAWGNISRDCRREDMIILFTDLASHAAHCIRKESCAA